MPSRNRVKIYVDQTYYHIYNRGVGKRRVFKDDEDYSVFCNLLKRYLDEKPTQDNRGRRYSWYRGKVELLAFCLMPNHFHLFVYAEEGLVIQGLMRGVCTSYSTYFNKKYHRVGHLFQDNYKASMVTEEGYFLHVSRYIHLNPTDWRHWKASSLKAYLGDQKLTWLQPERVLEGFSHGQYLDFLESYISDKETIDQSYDNLQLTDD